MEGAVYTANAGRNSGKDAKTGDLAHIIRRRADHEVDAS
jgi:hypothetical protein